MKFFSQFNRFKQKLHAIVLTLALLLVLIPATAQAYDHSAYYFWSGGKAIPAPPINEQSFNTITAVGLYINGVEQTDPHIFLAPVLGSTTYVPLRLVSEQLGAQVGYAKGVIQISDGNTELRLQLGETQAYKSTAAQQDQIIPLTVAPFVCDGSTYVPLRFIAESLDCTVWYHEGQVSIATEPLVIDGQAVDRMEYLAHATMGANVYRLQSNQLMRSIYQQLQACQSAPATAPAYVTSPSVALNGDFCRHISFDFYNAANELLYSITIYKQYQQPDQPAQSEPLRSYPFVVGDNLTNTFYSCTQEDYAKLSPLIDYCEAYGKLIHTAP